MCLWNALVSVPTQLDSHEHRSSDADANCAFNQEHHAKQFIGRISACSEPLPTADLVPTRGILQRGNPSTGAICRAPFGKRHDMYRHILSKHVEEEYLAVAQHRI